MPEKDYDIVGEEINRKWVREHIAIFEGLLPKTSPGSRAYSALQKLIQFENLSIDTILSNDQLAEYAANEQVLYDEGLLEDPFKKKSGSNVIDFQQEAYGRKLVAEAKSLGERLRNLLPW